VDGKLKEKKTMLLDSKVSTDCFDLLRDFLRMDFDHILTTNYTYELEAASQCDKKISNYRLEKMQRKTQEKVNLKYLIHTYNQVTFEGHETKVWHIHGEHRKPSSIVLGHYYYGNLLCEMKNEIKKIDKNRWGSDEEKCNRGESWLDAFLFGDIYCVGFGFGIFEFDLWWLLNRKAREKDNSGKMYYYDPQKMDNGSDHKMALFNIMKNHQKENLVEVVSLGHTIDEKNIGHDYQTFYSKVLTDIRERNNVSETDCYCAETN
jgi:hypothetical protein